MAVDTTYQPKTYRKDGGDKIIVASGGNITVESGGTVTVESGGVVTIAAVGGLKIGVDNVGVATIADVSANAAEINMAADSSVNSEIVTATNIILAAESGSTYFLNSATEFASTLPAPAIGLRFTFIVKAAPSGASYTILTNASANILRGHVLPADGAAGDTEESGGDTITIVDGQAVVGDRVDVISDGTYWYVQAACKVAAGITITTAS
jgi:hypothetical protein